MLDQLSRQVKAADGQPVIWYVTNDFTAMVIRKAVADGAETIGKVIVVVETLR
jgi:hypothetical protein